MTGRGCSAPLGAGVGGRRLFGRRAHGRMGGCARPWAPPGTARRRRPARAASNCCAPFIRSQERKKISRAAQSGADLLPRRESSFPCCQATFSTYSPRARPRGDKGPARRNSQPMLCQPRALKHRRDRIAAMLTTPGHGRLSF